MLSRSRGWASRDEMMRRTWENPAGPAMGNFPTIGDQLTSMVYNAWGWPTRLMVFRRLRPRLTTRRWIDALLGEDQ
ncbi:MAG: hypothetical protein ACFHX7_25255 [Pseudomonadota bacterium]